MLKVGILGCTGAVGQRFVQLLENHPWFQIHVIGASEKSAGQEYGKIVSWKLDTDIPERISKMIISPCIPQHFSTCDFVFSGLDSSVAGEVETAFCEAEIPVFSNSKNHRMDPDVPLIVPTVNESHFEMVHAQRKKKNLKRGFIVCNANCSTTGLVVPLRAIHDKFGIENCVVTTLQAISGAGYPGVSSMDITENVIPYISGEEDKIEEEPLKILGKFNEKTESFEFQNFSICATCNRVPVIDGHTECVVLKLKKDASLQEVEEAISLYKCEAQNLRLPSAPENCCVVLHQNDRPQPRMDRNRGKGYTVSVGRLRKSRVMDLKFTLLSHNTILGAAGSAILNAELAKTKGLI